MGLGRRRTTRRGDAGVTQYVPAHLDIRAILGDLNRVGYIDYKIETACGFSQGYVNQLKRGHISRISYEYGARLHNLWVDVVALHPPPFSLTLPSN